MEDSFYEFYKHTDTEIELIWRNCLFVFDTNILLNLYRYKKSTSDKYIEILKKIKSEERIWIPHQVGLEFHRRRHEIIIRMKNSYDKIATEIKSSFEEVKKAGEEYTSKHPFIDIKKIEDQIDKCSEEICQGISALKVKHPDWLNDDEILISLSSIFKGVVGNGYTKEELSSLYVEGIKRYDKKVPPGYMDSSKSEEEHQFGDFILWKQILKKAKESGKPIIFITEDKKEDWWLRFSGNTIGPRTELRREMRDFSGVDFHMYSSESFLKHAFEFYSERIDQPVLDEIQDMSDVLFKESIDRNHKTGFLSKELRSFILNQRKILFKILRISKFELTDLELASKIIESCDCFLDILEQLIRNPSNNLALMERLGQQQSHLGKELYVYRDNMDTSKKIIKKLIFYFSRLEAIGEKFIDSHMPFFDSELDSFLEETRLPFRESW